MFETPIFLIAALVGGLIPLLLHMMQRRRAQAMPFPTLRFLRMAQHSSSRRIRIEHLLLWLLRTLIMVLLGLAFAMPVLRSAGGGLLGRAPRDIAIVLDVSYSMGYLAGRETAFDQAVDTAVDLIEGLGESDRYVIILAGENPRALIAEPIADKPSGIAQVRALKPAYETSRLLPAVTMARDVLREHAGRRQQELHILTDNQAQAWGASGAAPETAAADPADGRLTVFVTISGAPAPENLTPRAIELQPTVLSAGGGARLSVELGHTGPPRETTVTFFINEREQARRAVTSGLPQTGRITFTVPPLPPGVHTGRVETPADNLPADDAFHFLLRVRDTMPTLVCGAPDDTFFLRAALQAAGGGAAAFTAVAPEALGAETLSDYATIFLCNALPLPGQVMMALERFVQRGGLLVLFPGSRAGVGDYRAWQVLPGVPRAVHDMARAQTRQTMHWVMPGHPVLQGMDAALTTPVVAVQRALRWDTLADDAVTLVAMGEDQPLLLERPAGDGRVLMVAVSADRAWSNFPLTPFYLPIVAQMVEYGSGLGSAPPFVWGGALPALERIMPDAGPGLRLSAPDGRPVPVRSVVQDGQTQLMLEDARQPGIYRRTDREPPVPALAINLPREESDLTPLDPGGLEALLGVDSLHIAIDRETLAGLLRQHRLGRTYGELLLWIVLLLVVAEFVVANWLARGRAPASDAFSLAPSGRVQGHAGAGLS